MNKIMLFLAGIIFVWRFSVSFVLDDAMTVTRLRSLRNLFFM